MVKQETGKAWKNIGDTEENTQKKEIPEFLEVRSQNENKQISVPLPQAPQNITNIFKSP